MDTPVYVGIINKLIYTGNQGIVSYKTIINLLSKLYNVETFGNYYLHVNNREIGAFKVPQSPHRNQIIKFAYDQDDEHFEIKLDLNMLISEQDYNESKLLMINDNLTNMIPRQEIIWQIEQCNGLMYIVNNYKRLTNKYMIIMNDLAENIKNVAYNTTINWTIINLFKKVDEFVVQIPRERNKPHNEMYYISLGTLAGIVYDEKNKVYYGTSCLMVFVNHKKKQYHLYPIMNFKHEKLQIYSRQLQTESINIIKDILIGKPLEHTNKINNLLHYVLNQKCIYLWSKNIYTTDIGKIDSVI